MSTDYEKIRKAAYKTLHLVFIKYVGPATYQVVGSEEEGGIPKLTDYVSFHHHKSLVRMKDIGSNIIYLLSPEQFKKSLLETMIQQNHEIEKKLRSWFPFLWGEGADDDIIRYESITRQLKEYPEFDETQDNTG
jgi:hypothetical protein